MLDTFLGYARADGRVGTRNHVLVLPLGPAANRAVALAVAEVSDLVHIQLTTDIGPAWPGYDFALRALRGWVDHPNVYACVLVALDQDDLVLQEIMDGLPQHVRVEVVTLAQEQGTRGAALRIKQIGRSLLSHAKKEARQAASVAHLLLATECGGSDACSGLSANPALGYASDEVIKRGGTSILAETTELIGAEKILMDRAVTPAIAAALLKTVIHAERASMRMGVDFRGAQPAPGNIEGGISTIEEKSLGCVHKGGTSPLCDVVDYAERPRGQGLVVMDTPGQDVMQLVGMASAGSQVMVFTTGRGTPTGSAIAPVIKVSTRTALKLQLPDHIDFDAGAIVSGFLAVDDVGLALYRKILSVASGERVLAEMHGQREFALFAGWGQEA